MRRQGNLAFRQIRSTPDLRFLKQLEATDDPRTLLLPYAGALAGYWKKRLGDYRRVCEISDHRLTLTVIKTGHRSKVYS